MLCTVHQLDGITNYSPLSAHCRPLPIRMGFCIIHRVVKLPWIFPEAPFNGVPGNIQNNLDGCVFYIAQSQRLYVTIAFSEPFEDMSWTRVTSPTVFSITELNLGTGISQINLSTQEVSSIMVGNSSLCLYKVKAELVSEKKIAMVGRTWNSCGLIASIT